MNRPGDAFALGALAVALLTVTLQIPDWIVFVAILGYAVYLNEKGNSAR